VLQYVAVPSEIETRQRGKPLRGRDFIQSMCFFCALLFERETAKERERTGGREKETEKERERKRERERERERERNMQTK